MPSISLKSSHLLEIPLVKVLKKSMLKLIYVNINNEQDIIFIDSTTNETYTTNA